jgi:protein SCO1/2
MRIALLILMLILADTAHAGLTERELSSVGIAPPPTAAVPLDLVLRDGTGENTTLREALADRPALLVPLDYTCRTTCGPALAIAAGARSQTGLRPGTDFHLIVVGIDPNDNSATARSITETRIVDEALAHGTRVLTGDTRAVSALLDAIGYRAAYDPESDQFAHPTAALTLTADGRVARVLSSLSLEPGDLRLALTEAGEGSIGELSDQIALLCYGYDPVHGIYTLAIRRILAGTAILTILALVLALILLRHRSSTNAEAP